MGNQQFKCPVGTTYGAAPLSCVMSCPTGYELRMVEGAQRCVSKADPDVSVHLVPQPAVARALDDHSAFEIDSLDHSSDLYMRYSAEKTRFNEELAVANVKVDHQKAVDAAEANMRATAGTPGAEAAGAAYVALTKDANAQNVLYESQAQAKIDKFLSDYQFLRNQSHQQQMTLDLVNTVKDKLFTVKDDMEYSVSTFDKQISDIRNQINVNRATQRQATDYGKWIGVGLNFAIVLALLFMIFVIGRKAMGVTSFTPSSGPLGAPARPPASEHTVELLKGLTGLLSASPK